VGFEPTTPVFERAKTVHALGHAATVIGAGRIYASEINVDLPLKPMSVFAVDLIPHI
jgi:hypothetical protein